MPKVIGEGNGFILNLDDSTLPMPAVTENK